MIKEVVWDMDDTMFFTNLHYDKAILEALYLMSNYFGNKFPSLEKVFILQKKFDYELHKLHGYDTKERFCTSLVKTYGEVAKIVGTPINKKISEILFEIGKKPFDIRCYDGQHLLPGVEETLNFLVEQNCDLKIYSKGIDDYQKQKIEFFNLYKWFKNDDEHIIIVPRKTPDDLRRHISKLEKACFITDSLEDVKMGIEAGVRVVHIVPPEIYRDRWGNEDEIPKSDLYKPYNNMLEFKADYHSL